MIKVAVRVRPFQAEEGTNTLCVNMPNENWLVMKDMEGTADREFHYDHCLWSFDGFSESSGGVR